jgi:hypothetical protein
MSNTKLNTRQKASRKSFLRDLESLNGSISTIGAFTVAKLPEFERSKMALFSVSVCSDTEQKNRRKVGEFHALIKLFNEDKYIILPRFICADGLASCLEDMKQGQEVFNPYI